MTQTFKVGQTVWWLNDNLRDVREATVTEVIIPEYGLQRDGAWVVKFNDGMRLVCVQFEIYSSKEDAYEAGFARIARMRTVALQKLDDAIERRHRLILSENAALRGDNNDPNGV